MTRKTNKPASNTKSARRRKKTARKAVSITIKRQRPVQITIFDYAESIGVALLPEDK